MARMVLGSRVVEPAGVMVEPAGVVLVGGGGTVGFHS